MITLTEHQHPINGSVDHKESPLHHLTWMLFDLNSSILSEIVNNLYSDVYI
jgi:hypothetical protein